MPSTGSWEPTPRSLSIRLRTTTQTRASWPSFQLRLATRLMKSHPLPNLPGLQSHSTPLLKNTGSKDWTDAYDEADPDDEAIREESVAPALGGWNIKTAFPRLGEFFMGQENLSVAQGKFAPTLANVLEGMRPHSDEKPSSPPTDVNTSQLRGQKRSANAADLDDPETSMPAKRQATNDGIKTEDHAAESFSSLPRCLNQEWAIRGRQGQVLFPINGETRENLQHLINLRPTPFRTNATYEGHVDTVLRMVNTNLRVYPLHDEVRRLQSFQPRDGSWRPVNPVYNFIAANSHGRTTLRLIDNPIAVAHWTPKPKFAFIDALCQQVDVFYRVCEAVDLEDLISLYAISKPFHFTVNRDLQSVIKNWTEYHIPGAWSALPFAAFAYVQQKDPMQRKGDIRTKAAYPDVRQIPSLRYLRLAHHHYHTCAAIIRGLESRGHTLPPHMIPVLLRIWVIMALPYNIPRIKLIQNTSHFPSAALVRATLFFVKLGMRFTDPIEGRGEDTGPRLDVQEFLVGYGCMENWGRTAETTPARLLRSDELVMRESFRRGLQLEWFCLDFVLHGHTLNRVEGIGAEELERLFGGLEIDAGEVLPTWDENAALLFPVRDRYGSRRR
ncbi:hypothetical protein EJ06DRAFT_321579 [Trichodelitschia bisporula]|uniref:Uncharacterized protein n=1 Tax=Trichodelitschia bisporula TaxID=703511 RepID=A0A6G1I4C8_9PEZI|nr:hypothetical protein EJ06DRAFT_321579 [Trichodelitschia bisporula]